ncbi:MAG: hypothetical protein Q9219_006099 [cf. Caloplaca sp. 3 TL-2023]
MAGDLVGRNSHFVLLPGHSSLRPDQGLPVIWQTQVDTLYTQYRIFTGAVSLTPTILDQNRVYMRTQVPIVILFYTSLYAVKLSFLLFFRRLGATISGQRVWWWIVLGITLASWMSGIGTVHYTCTLRPLQYLFTHCTRSSALLFEHRGFIAACVTDVVTDALSKSIGTTNEIFAEQTSNSNLHSRTDALEGPDICKAEAWIDQHLLFDGTGHDRSHRPRQCRPNLQSQPSRPELALRVG